ncbi:MAG: SAM-dependent methyltransferase, partial [Verrucomicrobiota bacterium]
REEGTLRSYRGHRAGEDVLSAVGEQDLTAHVNFSRLGSAVEATGMRVIGVEDQHDFVMRAGRGLLEEREGVADAGFAKQFQTLMHPGMMGRVFKVARFEKG